MYILFINSSGRRDIFFLLNLIIIVIKKINQSMWVGLDLCDELGWVEFFLTHHGGLGQKISLTRPNPTHAHPKVKCKSCSNRAPHCKTSCSFI